MWSRNLKREGFGEGKRRKAFEKDVWGLTSYVSGNDKAVKRAQFSPERSSQALLKNNTSEWHEDMTEFNKVQVQHLWTQLKSPANLQAQPLKHTHTFGVSTHSSSINAASAWQLDAGNEKASTLDACGRRVDLISRIFGECMVTGKPTVCACKYGKNRQFRNINTFHINTHIS